MKRLHVHVSVPDLADAIGFYSGLFAARPCCAGTTYANWRLADPALTFAASTGHAPSGALHMGLEVGTSAELRALERVVRARPGAAGIPWEVSVHRPPVRAASS